jgi:hypothetical protein
MKNPGATTPRPGALLTNAIRYPDSQEVQSDPVGETPTCAQH